jgi:hypothetical protein
VPRTGLDIDIHILPLPIIEPRHLGSPVCSLVIILTELYWLLMNWKRFGIENILFESRHFSGTYLAALRKLSRSQIQVYRALPLSELGYEGTTW